MKRRRKEKKLGFYIYIPRCDDQVGIFGDDRKIQYDPESDRRKNDKRGEMVDLEQTGDETAARDQCHGQFGAQGNVNLSSFGVETKGATFSFLIKFKERNNLELRRIYICRKIVCDVCVKGCNEVK